MTRWLAAVSLLLASCHPQGGDAAARVRREHVAMTVAITRSGVHAGWTKAACGGVVVGPRHIATIRHCIDYVAPKGDIDWVPYFTRGDFGAGPMSYGRLLACSDGTDPVCILDARRTFTRWATVDVQQWPGERPCMAIHGEGGDPWQVLGTRCEAWATYVLAHDGPKQGASGSGLWIDGWLVGIAEMSDGITYYAAGSRIVQALARARARESETDDGGYDYD